MIETVKNRTMINSSEFSKQELLLVDHDRPDENLQPKMKHYIIHAQEIKIKMPNSSREQVFSEELVPWSDPELSNSKFKCSLDFAASVTNQN